MFQNMCEIFQELILRLISIIKVHMNKIEHVRNFVSKQSTNHVKMILEVYGFRVIRRILTMCSHNFSINLTEERILSCNMSCVLISLSGIQIIISIHYFNSLFFKVKLNIHRIFHYTDISYFLFVTVIYNSRFIVLFFCSSSVTNV